MEHGSKFHEKIIFPDIPVYAIINKIKKKEVAP